MRYFDYKTLRDVAYTLSTTPSKRYIDYIRGPKWAKVRRWKLESTKYRCEICPNRACQVHHRHYGTLGNECLADLVSVCVRCHHRLHAELIPVITVDQLELPLDAANDNEAEQEDAA